MLLREFKTVLCFYYVSESLFTNSEYLFSTTVKLLWFCKYAATKIYSSCDDRGKYVLMNE